MGLSICLPLARRARARQDSRRQGRAIRTKARQCNGDEAKGMRRKKRILLEE